MNSKIGPYHDHNMVNLCRRTIVIFFGLAMLACDMKKDQQLTTHHSDDNLSQEELVIEAVRSWYRDAGLLVPQRIVVSERSDNFWRLLAGPEIKEAGFDVDPRTYRVIRYSPGD